MQGHGQPSRQGESGERRKPPYGPVSPVTEILEHYRKHDLPPAFDRALLQRLDIAPNNESKVLNTLHWLGFTDESGQPTTVFRRLQASTTEEFERVLKERIRSGYNEIFAQLDPSTAPFDEIYRYFAHNFRVSLGDSMARLFVGLCQSAGMPMPEIRRNSSPAARRPVQSLRGPAQRRPSVETEARLDEEAAPDAAALVDRQDGLRRRYLGRLIDGFPTLVIDASIDPQTLRVIAEIRAMELDRIERLLEEEYQ